jgi:hypothetical protein
MDEELIFLIVVMGLMLFVIIASLYFLSNMNNQPIINQTNTTNIFVTVSISTVIEGNASEQLILTPNGTLVINYNK